jgi:Flp pilus assembly protein TadG
MRAAGRGKKSKRHCGVVAAELALILPVLVLLVLLCIDVGRFAYTFIALKNSARAGASYAIMNPYVSSTQAAWTAKIQTVARNEMTGQTGYDPTALTTTADVTIESSGLHRVKVTATYASFQTIISWPGIPSSLSLQCATEMRAVR